ncbi:peptidoglycan-binding domain-containing protein [Streptomyces sp. NPDC049099]|uniref:peptidoglycan-binding domain-containing protein n=1 Tax=Streptomyces sp. NPDC049099 TaxID=3155768 RepID=UPI003414191B
MPTPLEPERPHSGRILEPVRVVRPRSFDALAELMREMETGPARAAPTDEAKTQELPPVPPAPVPPGAAGPSRGLRLPVVAGALAAAALLGFGCALLLPVRHEAAASAHPPQPAVTASPPATTPAPTPTPTPSPAATATTDPDGPGTLRQGDTGPEVTDLQRRLLRVPDVYRDGSADGTYDATLTAAVARFQLWYGISGDETGVYGDDTRRALESRTGPGDDA